MDRPPYMDVQTYTKTTTKNLRGDVSCKNVSPSLKDSEQFLKEKKGRGSRLSQSWELPESDREWALKRGMFNEQIDVQAERFKDYWISTTKNATKLDWSATWRNWLRQAKDVCLKDPISTIHIEPQTPIIKKSSDPKIQEWYDMKGNDLEERYGKGIWKSWLEPLELLSFSKETAIFKAKSRFMADHIKTHYLSGIYKSLKKINPEFGASSTFCRYPEEDSVRIIFDE